MDLSLDCCHLERRESCLQHQPGTAFALMKHNITWNCSVPKGQRFQSPEKPSSEPAQAGCWSAAGNASLIPLRHHPWATLLFPLRASSLRQEGLLSDGITPTHSLPLSQHPPSWRGILHLCPAQSLQEQPELQLLEICLHHRVPGSENVSGLQRTFPNAASIQHRAPSCRAAGMGHPKRERIDPSRDRHILVPAVWAVQDRDTCGHCPLSGSGVGKGGDA